MDSNFHLPGCVSLIYESCNLEDWLSTSKLKDGGNPLVEFHSMASILGGQEILFH